MMLAERAQRGLGLTAPELAVLLAYAKITLEEDLLASRAARRPRFPARAGAGVPDRDSCPVPGPHSRAPAATRDHRDSACERRRQPGRPDVRLPARRGDRRDAARHRARARSGPRDLRPGRRCGATIEALDGHVDVDVQTDMYLASRRLVERGARWLLRSRPRPLPVAATVAEFAAPAVRLRALAELTPEIEPVAARYAARGVPRSLAQTVAALERLPRALDIAELARTHGAEVETVAADLQRDRATGFGSTGSPTASSSCPVPAGGTRSPATRCAKTSRPSSGQSPTR